MNWIISNWKVIAVALVAAEHAVVAVYVTIVHMGGVKTIANNFVNGPALVAPSANTLTAAGTPQAATEPDRTGFTASSLKQITHNQ
jgi:hypothetical protein